MIERAFIHVAGPVGAGKTTFVETVLRGVDRWWLAQLPRSLCGQRRLFGHGHKKVQ